MNREELTVGFFHPEDAEGVATLFRGIYGDHYPAKIVYDPGQLIEAVENRDNIPIVVRTPDHRVVGYSSLFRAAPDKGVYEKGNGAVARDFRNAGVMGMIFQFVKEMLPTISDVSVLFGEPVCNHTYIQKAALATLPFVETAIEIDVMPSEAYEKEQSALGRVSTLLMFITVVPKPQTIYVPGRYREYFEYIYQGLDDRRSFSLSKDDFSPLCTTRIDTQVFEFARLARITVHEAGSDFERLLVAEEQAAINRNARVIQVWLRLSWPWIGRAVDLVKDHGYFFGGILPQWFGEDGLLMQKILPSINWEGIHLSSERAQKILEFIKADRPSQ